MKKYLIGLASILMLLVVAGCGNTKDNNQSKLQTQVQDSKIVGAYKSDDDYNETDDGTIQPSYWYFKKDGKLLYCEPQVDSSDPNSDTDFWYGDAYRGTWKALGDSKYQLKFHDVYDDDYYTIKAKLDGKKLITYSTPKSAKCEWNEFTNKKIDMTYSDYIDMFDNAKKSDLEYIKENGYYEPDSADSNEDVTDPKTIGVLLLASTHGGFDDLDGDDLEYMIMEKPNTYQIGLGTKSSTLNYTVDGDKVTYTDGALDYSQDSAKTVSIKKLVDEYYSSSDDKSTIDDLVADANVTDFSNQ